MARRRRRQAGGSLRPHLAAALLLLGVLLALVLPGLRRRPAVPPLPAGDVPGALEQALPGGLSPLRRAFVEHAAALVGQVGYFWGGKSDRLGWDERWGVPAVVSAPGSESTGASVPFGLDCSGYVCWTAVNAAGDPSAYAQIGDGVRGQWAACAPVAWEDALPGDLAFFPDLSHVGIVAGWGGDGNLLVLHCSYSLGGVVCSPDAQAAGFTLLGRPAFFAELQETNTG